MRDAFEIALVDDAGRPLTFTIQGNSGPVPASATAAPVLPPSPDALFNYTDGHAPFLAPGAALSAGNSRNLALAVDLSQLPPGFPARLILRLVNNDADHSTAVRLTDVRLSALEPGLNFAGSPHTALPLAVGSESTTPENDGCPPLLNFTAASPPTGPKLVSGAGAGPDLAILNPRDRTTMPVASALLTGQVMVHGPDGGPASAGGATLVTVNGRPVEALDAGGAFFALISVREGQNRFEVVAADDRGQHTTNTISVTGTVCPERFASLGWVTTRLEAQPGHTSFADWTQTLYAELALRNTGTEALRAPLYVSVTHISDPTVRLLAPDGLGADGVPFYEFAATLPGGSLPSGAQSAARALAFYNPNQSQFTYDLTILAQVNQPPRFTTVPPCEAIAGHRYNYASEAQDPDGGPLLYSLLEAPSGMTVNPANGQVTWNVTNGIGTYPVRLRATNGHGRTAEQPYQVSVIVAPPNRPPVFVSTPVNLVHLGSRYDYEAGARDPDGDPLAYALVAAPASMSIDAANGKLQWTPWAGDLGTHVVTLTVSDGRGGEDRQTYALCVQPAEGNRPPLIVDDPITDYLLAEAPVITNAVTLAMTVRDFRDDHPDFEQCLSLFVTRGLVQPVLGPDRTPVYARTGPASWIRLRD